MVVFYLGGGSASALRVEFRAQHRGWEWPYLVRTIGGVLVRLLIYLIVIIDLVTFSK